MLMSKSKSLSMALFMAYRALAAPVLDSAPEANIQAVIAALKVELQAITPDADSLIDSVDAQLRLNGALSEENVAALDQAILEISSSSDGVDGIDATTIANGVIDILAEGHALEGDDIGEIEGKTLTISTEMINEPRGWAP